VSAELLTCPFCGAEVTLDRNQPKFIYHRPDDTTCPLAGRNVFTREWNRRAAQQQPPEAVSAGVPDSVRYAVERMSIALDPSRLGGATAKEDARCMLIIADFISSLTATQPPQPSVSDGSVPRHFRMAFRDHERNERHWTNEETRFWCAQYKLLAKEAIAALAAAPQPTTKKG
jgi:RNA polymerase subunit RPABC4/transcription elongation factor Spt4